MAKGQKCGRIMAMLAGSHVSQDEIASGECCAGRQLDHEIGDPVSGDIA
jgi:hypothetical protein